MKKFILLSLVFILAVFFTLPSALFSAPGDEYTSTDKDATGQFQMDITSPEDGDTDPDTDVYCIDNNYAVNMTVDGYVETDVMVSDELQIAGGDDPPPGIPEEDAVAVEIIATTATGASNSDNQKAVWDIIRDDTPLPASTIEKIVDAVGTIADGFVADITNPTIAEYLDAQNVNKIEVSLSPTDPPDPDGAGPLPDPDGPLIDGSGDYNDFTATAIMENPLVPGVTDEGKNTYWYILGGSYNVSFSQAELKVVETSVMSDYTDDATDIDGDGKIPPADDHYGMATIPFYFYWWGAGYPEFEEMNVNIFAWVDIDDDDKLDIEDIPDRDATAGDQSLDGDVVGDFVTSHQVVNIDGAGNADGTESISATELPAGGNFEFDIDEREAGKVLIAKDDVSDTVGSPDENYPIWQRFVIESYGEPYDDALGLYSAWGSITVTKRDAHDESLIQGAVFALDYVSGQTIEPGHPDYLYQDPIPDETTGADGKATFTHLPWALYYAYEVSPAPGYLPNYGFWQFLIGGNDLDQAAVINDSVTVFNEKVCIRIYKELTGTISNYTGDIVFKVWGDPNKGQLLATETLSFVNGVPESPGYLEICGLPYQTLYVEEFSGPGDNVTPDQLANGLVPVIPCGNRLILQIVEQEIVGDGDGDAEGDFECGTVTFINTGKEGGDGDGYRYGDGDGEITVLAFTGANMLDNLGYIVGIVLILIGAIGGVSFTRQLRRKEK